MLDGLLAYIAEIVKMGMIMVDIGNGREIEPRNAVLDDCKIREVRHESVHHSCQRIGIWILGH